jgi:hypothetical protein
MSRLVSYSKKKPIANATSVVAVAVNNPISGLKRALFVGINYVGTPYELSGCINDAINMSNHVRRFFPMCKEHRILTDTGIKPTRQAILDGLAWLIEGLKAGEHVLFHFSGHGGLVRDTNGDEVSGLDGCIYGVNNAVLELITDDDLRSRFANKIPNGSKCFVILDACHSGTAVDLRCSWQVPSTLTLYYEENPVYEKTAGQVVLISGCRDNQTSADTVNSNGIPCGALTWALLETWKQYGTAIKLKYILWDIHVFLGQRGYTQKPQLTLGHYLDINTVFDMSVA